MLVIKIGGGAAIGEGGYTNFAEDLAALAEPVVVVHGGNGRLPLLVARQLGLPAERVWSETASTGNLGSASLPVAYMIFVLLRLGRSKQGTRWYDRERRGF